MPKMVTVSSLHSKRKRLSCPLCFPCTVPYLVQLYTSDHKTPLDSKHFFALAFARLTSAWDCSPLSFAAVAEGCVWCGGCWGPFFLQQCQLQMCTMLLAWALPLAVLDLWTRAVCGGCAPPGDSITTALLPRRAGFLASPFLIQALDLISWLAFAVSSVLSSSFFLLPGRVVLNFIFFYFFLSYA